MPIVINHFGGLDSLVIKEVPEPETKPGPFKLIKFVLIKSLKVAFGVVSIYC